MKKVNTSKSSTSRQTPKSVKSEEIEEKKPTVVLVTEPAGLKIHAEGEPLKVEFTKLTPDAIFPEKTSEGVYSLFAQLRKYLERKERTPVVTGIALKIPKGYIGFVVGRRRIFYNYGAFVIPGIVHASDEPQEIFVKLQNMFSGNYEVMKGREIANLVILKTGKLEEVFNEYSPPEESED